MPSIKGYLDLIIVASIVLGLAAYGAYERHGGKVECVADTKLSTASKSMSIEVKKNEIRNAPNDSVIIRQRLRIHTW